MGGGRRILMRLRSILLWPERTRKRIVDTYKNCQSIDEGENLTTFICYNIMLERHFFAGFSGFRSLNLLSRYWSRLQGGPNLLGWPPLPLLLTKNGYVRLKRVTPRKLLLPIFWALPVPSFKGKKIQSTQCKVWGGLACPTDVRGTNRPVVRS